jgi:hypothetical protein
MANLIRLKQIESGSQLGTAATVGQDFSASVFEIIDGAGLISSSAQVTLLDASGYNEFVATLDINGIATDVEVYVTSSQIIDQGEW